MSGKPTVSFKNKTIEFFLISENKLLGDVQESFFHSESKLLWSNGNCVKQWKILFNGLFKKFTPVSFKRKTYFKNPTRAKVKNCLMSIFDLNQTFCELMLPKKCWIWSFSTTSFLYICIKSWERFYSNEKSQYNEV